VKTKMEKKRAKSIVRDGYAKIADSGGSCCPQASTCCGDTDTVSEISRRIGYTEAEVSEVPEGANLGLGCGNPVALASLREGEVVLDLGSGAGFDCFLAAKRVGENGRVIGVDMTPEMVERARRNAEKGSYGNVEFRLGEIENLPVADNAVDVVISNCVINLSPDKERVFKEAFRVLKPGGRLMISDIVLVRQLPNAVKNSVEAYIACLSGAVMKDEYLRLMERAGFRQIEVIEESSFPTDYLANDPSAKGLIRDLNVSPGIVEEMARSVLSMRVRAEKPE